jgi:hypothetical protein
MMSDVKPGRHPNFDITQFAPEEQRVLRRMEQMFHLTRHGDLNLGQQKSRYNYALIKPTGRMRGILHTDREIMVVFSNYSEFQARSIDAFDAIVEETHEEFRIEKVVRILISGDKIVAKKAKSIFKSLPDAPIVIPFHFSEFLPSTPESAIVSRIREFTFSRDLFSMSSPLKSDLYFYGRSDIINEISSKLSSGENFGLFGLRRSGKTSLIAGVGRSLIARGGSSISVDCQSPSVHQLRWNELLRQIALDLKAKFNVKWQVGDAEAYNEKRAANSFLEDVRTINKQAKKPFTAILFDEIERIAPGTASSDHWNDQKDFLLFWQSMRAAFQSVSSPIVYLIVGTNPKCIETFSYGGSDNPLYGNVEKRFIPMFSVSQVSEMVSDLGSIMGVEFDEECKVKLYQDFGGHPFLTRYACSFIAKATSDRPITVDRTIYARGIQEYTNESAGYVESVVGLLKSQYPDENVMLDYFGCGDIKSFNTLADADPNLLEHLFGYGILKKGINEIYFNIGIVERYFSMKEKPVDVVTPEDRLAEVSRRRNALEKSLRRHINLVFRVNFPKSKRRDMLISKLLENRRKMVEGFEFDSLLSETSSPLFFKELISIILAYWEKFDNSLDMSKNEFEYHANVVNSLRKDAHANDFDEKEFSKARVSLTDLESLFS